MWRKKRRKSFSEVECSRARRKGRIFSLKECTFFLQSLFKRLVRIEICLWSTYDSDYSWFTCKLKNNWSYAPKLRLNTLPQRISIASVPPSIMSNFVITASVRCPSGSTIRAMLIASEVAKSVLAGVTARISVFGFSMKCMIISVICFSKKKINGWKLWFSQTNVKWLVSDRNSRYSRQVDDCQRKHIWRVEFQGDWFLRN